MSFFVLAATTCFLLGAVNLFLGIAVLRDGVRERLHRVTALMLFFGGIGAFLAGLGLAARASAPAGTAVFTDVALHFASIWEFFFPSLLLFTLVFPTEHRWLKRFGGLQEIIFVPYVFHLVLTLVADHSKRNFYIPEIIKLAGWTAPLLTPLRVALSLLYDAHAVMFSLVNLGYVALTLTVLSLRARQVANPRLRAQMHVMFWGLGTCLVLYSLVAPLPTLLGASGAGWERFTAPLLVLSLLAGSGSIAYSIIRHRFLDARLLVRRSIAFLGVAGVLAAVYLLVMRRLEGFVGTVSALDTRVIEPVLLMIGLVVLQPAVNRVEELLDRWQMRDRREGRALLQQISRDIVTLMDLPTLGARLTHAVFDSLVTEGVALVGRPTVGAPLELVACAGFPQVPYAAWGRLAGELETLPALERPVSLREIALRGDTTSAARLAALAPEFPIARFVPLHHGGRLLGALVLGPKVATPTCSTRTWSARPWRRSCTSRARSRSPTSPPSFRGSSGSSWPASTCRASRWAATTTTSWTWVETSSWWWATWWARECRRRS
jgi:hypothetical protein